MIPLPTGVRVWVSTGHTDMRRGMQSLALQVQEGLKRDPHAGDLYVFRGRSGSLIKILWHDGIGMSLYACQRAAESPQFGACNFPHFWRAVVINRLDDRGLRSLVGGRAAWTVSERPGAG